MRISIHKRMSIRDLPEDMQVLIAQFYELFDYDLPEKILTKKIPISYATLASIEAVSGGDGTGSDTRNYKDYRSSVNTMPPIIAWKNVLYDGRHRISAARDMHVVAVPVFNLSLLGLHAPNTVAIGYIHTTGSPA